MDWNQKIDHYESFVHSIIDQGQVGGGALNSNKNKLINVDDHLLGKKNYVTTTPIDPGQELVVRIYIYTFFLNYEHWSIQYLSHVFEVGNIFPSALCHQEEIRVDRMLAARYLTPDTLMFYDIKLRPVKDFDADSFIQSFCSGSKYLIGVKDCQEFVIQFLSALSDGAVKLQRQTIFGESHLNGLKGEGFTLDSEAETLKAELEARRKPKN